MTAKRIILFALVALFVLAACSPAARAITESTTDGFFTGGDGAAPDVGVVSPETEPLPVDSDGGFAGEEGAQAPPGSGVGQTQVDRLVIRNANLSLLVANPVEANDRIAALAASLNGFVVSSNVYHASTDAEGNKIMQASITVRVPSDQLDAALAQIRALAV